MKIKELTLPVFSLENGKKLQDETMVFTKEKGVDNTHIFYLTKKYQQAGSRAGTASTKTLSEVSGGGSKPFKQKGTGRARRGSNRTVLRPGGGVVFGPSPRSFAHKLNKKMVKNAILGALIENKENIHVIKFDNPELKTKQVAAFIGESTAPLVIVKSFDSSLFRAARNIYGMKLCSVYSIPIEKLLASNKVLIEQDAWDVLKEVNSHE